MHFVIIGGNGVHLSGGNIYIHVVYKIPYRRAPHLASRLQPLGRVRRASKGILHTNIHAASRAEQYIAHALACDIPYVPDGANPRTTYFRIARRARRAQVLFDTSARARRGGYGLYPLQTAYFTKLHSFKIHNNIHNN